MSQIPMVKEKYLRRQAVMWLMASGVAMALGAIIWLTGTSTTTIAQEKSDTDRRADVSDLTLPKSITELNELQDAVAAISDSTLIRDLRSYPPEFKDKAYFQMIGKRYAIQLMDVAENQVIVDYLNSRSDRRDFAYFRYTDGNKKARYILTYGQFDNASQAQARLKAMTFDLPNSIIPQIKKVAEFVAVVDRYEVGEEVIDLANSQPRQIRLQATNDEIAAAPAILEEEELARLNREKRLEQERRAVATDTDIQNDINRLVMQSQRQPMPPDLPMAPTAYPESLPSAQLKQQSVPKQEIQPQE